MAEIQIRIADDKKKEFKELCDKNKDKMAEVLKMAIDDYIKKGGVKNDK